MDRQLHINKLFLLILTCILMVNLMLPGCGGGAVVEEEEETQAPPIEGKTIIVDSTSDSGPGSFRQALSDAESGDIITFDVDVFPTNNPATIYPINGLPPITQGYLTIDASNTGVIIDGSQAQGEWVVGITFDSDNNTIYGLQITNFSGAGIILDGGGNIIGGDRLQGNGPVGRGNLISANADGIGIRGTSSTGNRIIGNLIGTDISGENNRGNQNPGIFISDGAKSTTIGPDNIIAYNQFGVEIRDANSSGNTITQNSIYDNKLGGISFQTGIDGGATIPVILEYNLEDGIVSGVCDPNCIVEIFSDDDDEGRVFEEQVQADEIGSFSLNRGSSFSGPNLTAIATNAEGNTSGFSAPISGTARYIILQEENEMRKTLLRTKQSRELVDNRIGNYWHGLYEVQLDFQDILNTEISRAGLKWVRLAINSCDVPTINWDSPEFTIAPLYDDWITDIADNGVDIMYVLSFWDKENWPRELIHSRFKTEEDIESYLDFVRFIVRHFKDRVEYFEIWNEPTCGESCPEDRLGCLQHIDVNDYINLVKRTIPVIHEESPDAKIVIGVVPGIWMQYEHDYLFSLLNSDIMPLVDAISWHPMYSTSPEHEYWREYYYNYPSLIQDIKDVASVHGFSGEYIVEELSWWTEENAPQGQDWFAVLPYSETVCAKYCARVIIMHLGLDVRVGTCLSAPIISNLCTVMAGADPSNLVVEIESEVTNIKSYSFSLSNDEKLIALWTDGMAVDEDPGIEATMTIPEFPAQIVTAIDVLNGIEQKLITSIENGKLVIRNILVKDYPIILRLSH